MGKISELYNKLFSSPNRCWKGGIVPKGRLVRVPRQMEVIDSTIRLRFNDDGFIKDILKEFKGELKRAPIDKNSIGMMSIHGHTEAMKWLSDFKHSGVEKIENDLFLYKNLIGAVIENKSRIVVTYSLEYEDEE